VVVTCKHWPCGMCQLDVELSLSEVSVLGGVSELLVIYVGSCMAVSRWCGTDNLEEALN
jgi:hypothetical protein